MFLSFNEFINQSSSSFLNLRGTPLVTLISIKRYQSVFINQLNIMNQPLKIKQYINQSINALFNHSIINQTIYMCINLFTNKATDKLHQSIFLPINLFNRTVDESINQSIHIAIMISSTNSTNHPIDRSIEQDSRKPCSQSANQLAFQAVSQQASN